ncbi:MAG: Bug family tripartite tricarboxylate transporter substrate binding protein [Burkholderiales bacterium]
MMRIITRSWLVRYALATFAATSVLGLSTALAQSNAWPERPVRIIVPFPAGGAADVLTRVLAEQLQMKLGQPFVIENRTGAAGNIGMEAGAKAAPDGYTIASATIGTLAINQFLSKGLPYDPERSFAYVSTFWMNCNVFLVPSQHNPAKTLHEFLAWAKARPQGVTFGSSGAGTTPHLSGEMFRLRTGLKAIHVPSRGAAQTIPMLLSGDLDFGIDNLASYTALLQSGQVRALAVTSAERWPTLPDIPTMAEAGVPDFVVTSWGAFVMPAGTPPAIVDRLSAAIGESAADPAVQKRFLATGARAVATTPKETVAFVERERQKWGEVVRASGARTE